MTGAAHTHRPLLWVCVCFILGIIIEQYLKIPFAAIFILTVLCLLLSLFIRGPTVSTIFILLAIVCLGLGYSKNYLIFPPSHICHIPYGDRKDMILVEGVVMSDVEPRDFFKGRKTLFTLELKRIKSKRGWEEKRGRVLVNLFREEAIRYGDYLALEGKLHRPFNFSRDSTFSYRDYLSRKGILFILSVKKTGRVERLKQQQGHFIIDVFLRAKHRLNGILKNNLPEEEAGMMQAFLLGDRYGIPKNVYDLFKVSGVAHIIAISGFNIGIVAYGILFFLKMFPIPRRGQYLLTIALLISYAFLTGGQPSVVRATITAVVFLMSFLFEREQEPMNTLALSALIILLMNPLNVFDVGFQLSFMSVMAIYFFYSIVLQVLYKPFPGLKSSSAEKKRPGGAAAIKVWVVKYLLQSLALSLAVYLVVGPLIVYYFRLMTPIVIFANLVVVPLASFMIFLGMGLLLVGVIFPFVAFAFANGIMVLLNLMVASVALLARIPGAYVEIKGVPFWAVVLYYTLMALIFFAVRFMKSR
ncbi:MAG: ComEC/Rec2 family competence protein [Candidatus Omnitrophota bacterium]|jgi:competence protein ComEC